MVRRLFALSLATMLVAACGGSPTAPLPPAPTCQEAGANNIGGPLPCTFPPPAQSFIRLTAKSPEGATFSAEKKEEAEVGAEYGVSAEELAEAVRSGNKIIYRVCLSEDGVNPLPLCSTKDAPGSSGGGTFKLHVNPQATPGLERTKHVIGYLISQKPSNGQPVQPDRERVITQSAIARTWNWRP